MTATEYHTRGADRFWKVEGLGNDFVVLDARSAATPPLSLEDRLHLCDRHRGIGADGVLTLLAPLSDAALCTMHVTNADGSVPEMCGNGLRCVAWWLAHAGVAPRGEKFLVDTGAGPLEVHVPEAGESASIAMGPARTEGVLVEGELLQGELRAEGRSFNASALSMGNPHLVLFDALTTDVVAAGGLPAKLGPILVKSELFPEGANVGFARQRSETALDLVVYERGVGLTEACGTGACACAAAYVQAGRCPPDTPLTVRLPGGLLSITVRSDLGAVQMEGPARVVFEGQLEPR